MESRRNTRVIELIVAALIGGATVALVVLITISTGTIPLERSNGAAGTAGILSGPALDRERAPETPNLVNRIYREEGDGVVFITASTTATGAGSSGPYGAEQGQATGSGFVIEDNGLVVTNNHVVAAASEIAVKVDGQDYDATVVGSDSSTDLALLKIDAPPEDLTPLPLADSDRVRVGDPVIAIGNPFGLERTVTTGIVSAVQREITSTDNYSISGVIQTDAAINPGNSGGPLIDSEGRVIGVNSQIATGGSGTGNVGIGFSIPANTVSEVVEQLLADGKVEHAWLGISGVDVTGTGSPESVLPEGRSGVAVAKVVDGSPASRAGISTGSDPDVIVEVDGRGGITMEEIAAIVNEAEVGDRLELTVMRNRRERTVQVTLGDRP